MLDLDATTTGLCAVGRCGACDRARTASAALRAVLAETTPEELAEVMAIAALAYLKRKAGVTL